MKRYLLLAAAAVAAPMGATAQTAAPAPAAVTVTTGATVYDTSGGVVGTIASTDGTNAVIDTGTVKAAIPLTSLGKGAKGPVLAMTKAQLDAAAGQQQAQASAEFKSKLVAGATVYGTGGASLGTIKSVDASGITLTTANGEAKLPASGFGPGPQGITLGMSADQLAAAMNAAAPASTSGAATEPTATGASTATTGTTTTDTAAPSTPGTTEEASTAAPGATSTTTPAKTKKPRR